MIDCKLVDDLEFKIQSEYFAYKHEFSKLTEQEKVSYFFTRLNLWKTIYLKYPLTNKAKDDCDRFNKELVDSIEIIKEKNIKIWSKSIIGGGTCESIT